MNKLSLMYVCISMLVATPAIAQHQAMPAGMSHDEHLKQIQKDEDLKHRGALAMGFDQDRTEHHFLLRASGGAIVVTVKRASDVQSLGQIRSHLAEIAAAFSAGEFDKPLATHGEVPPGADVMAANRRTIAYRYEDLPQGGRVVIVTSDLKTLKAVHDFLRYQIAEHKTGDPLIVQ